MCFGQNYMIYLWFLSSAKCENGTFVRVQKSYGYLTTLTYINRIYRTNL